MQISFDTREITDLDRQIFAVLAGGASAPAAAPKASAASKSPIAEKAKVEEPAAESTSGPTMADAVDAATKLVGTGKAAAVKAALADVGAKRVSELDEGDIPAFLAALADA